MLQCFIMCCSVRQGNIRAIHPGYTFYEVCCSVHVAVCCSVLQCVVVCCNVLQCVAVCCSLQYDNIQAIHSMRCVAVCMLQRVAVHCSVH